MSIITLPETVPIGRMSWMQQRQDMEGRSLFGAQAVEVGAPLWAISIMIPNCTHAESGEWKSLLMRLRGRTNLLAAWDVGRPRPLGTLRGNLTLKNAVTQGETVLMLNAGVGQVGATLLPGDLIGLGSGLTQQVVMATTSTVVVSSGEIGVVIEPPLRNGFPAGAAVVWDKPKALFRRQSSKVGWDYEKALVAGSTIELLEDPRP